MEVKDSNFKNTLTYVCSPTGAQNILTIGNVMNIPIIAVLFLFFSIYEIANISGFSFVTFSFLPKSRIIDSAIRFSYPGIYKDLQELKKDYSDFEPEVRYWGSWSWQVENGIFEKLVGLTNYQVRLPEEIVMVTKDGVAQFSRADSSCNDDRGCPFAIPDKPEQGIVGTVQYGPPNYETAPNFTLEWLGTNSGRFLKYEHCFSTYIHTPINLPLMVKPQGVDAKIIQKGYGFYLVSVRSDGYASMRISKAAFEKFRSCDKNVRNSWPNVGGAAWRR